MRAAARVVIDRGYQALSIPAISAVAGVSNQTFYEHFQSKRDPFLAAFREITDEVLQIAGGAFFAESDRPAAIGAGTRALLDYLAGHDLYARLAFFELPSAGPAALDQAEGILDGFTAFLRPETDTAGARPTDLDGDTAGHRQRDLGGDPVRDRSRSPPRAAGAGGADHLDRGGTVERPPRAVEPAASPLLFSGHGAGATDAMINARRLVEFTVGVTLSSLP